jgi:adenylosuccinate lyase
MLASRAVELLADLLGTLEVDEQRMRANLEASGGAVLSEALMLPLATRWGRDAAHRLLLETAAGARSRGQSFIDAVRGTSAVRAALTNADLDQLLDYDRHAGRCAAMVEQILAEPS